MEREDNPQRVLVVDDEPAIRDVVAKYLRDEGFIVDEAGDGIAALEKAAASPPDLIVLDLNLPSLSGKDVFRQVRAVNDVPIVMLTSRDEEIDRVVGLELGADDYKESRSVRAKSWPA